MDNKIYYVTETHLDSSYSWNGLKTITGYEIQSNDFENNPHLVKLFELECATDGDYTYLKSDEEEIQDWLDENGLEDEEFEFVQL